MLRFIVRVSFFAVVAVSAFAGHALECSQQLLKVGDAEQGRLGVYALDTNNGKAIAYHSSERFPLCSASKVMVAAALLKRSMQQPALLDDRVSYNRQAVTLSGYAPITGQHIKDGLTNRDLARVTLEYSDNLAANLLMNQLSGPSGVTQFARSIGDLWFNLVRTEPTLNTAIPGDIRDTTTPHAMALSLQRLVLGAALNSAQRNLLKLWMIANTTGDARIRAGIPRGWVVADKTGTGDYGTTNDIAVIWPPHCKPLVMAVFYSQFSKNAAPKPEVIAEVARNSIAYFTKHDACLAALHESTRQ